MSEIIERVAILFKVSICLTIVAVTLTLCVVLIIASLICRFIEGKDL